jgi:hypothetical protein
MYDARQALQGIDLHTLPIMVCLLITVFAAFLYFAIAFRMAVKQKVYVVPFIGSALFFWHDLSFVMLYDRWFNLYDHWWVKMWWFALVGTVIFELLMIWQVYQYGHKELWPNLSKRAFGALLVLGTLGIGAMWLLLKVSMGDELFFITFIITAVFSVPFHTAIMSRRQSRAGQSAVMELATIVMLWCLTAAFAQVAPFFSSTPFLVFVGAFTLWPLANVWLMYRLPKAPAPAAVETKIEVPTVHLRRAEAT